jgi:hypothetical protein
MHKNEAHIAIQCPKRWHEMRGKSKVRLCESCQNDVYNLSDMTHTEAAQFMANVPKGACLIYGHDREGEIIHAPELDVPWLPSSLKRVLSSVVVMAALLPAEIACGAESGDYEHTQGWEESYNCSPSNLNPTPIELQVCPNFVDMLTQDMSKQDMSDMFTQDMPDMLQAADTPADADAELDASLDADGQGDDLGSDAD